MTQYCASLETHNRNTGPSPCPRPAPPSYFVWHRFKEYGGGGDLFLVGHEAVSEVTSIGQVKPHYPAVGLHQGCVDSKVSWRP